MMMHPCNNDHWVATFGKPDYFITMTANPNWSEVRNNLRPGEATHNRPDLMARVFRLKLKELLKDLLDEHVLGRVKAYTYVVEFQKRGLPHVHLLLIMDSADKLKTARDIDRVVSAELPCAQTQGPLRDLVERFMLHGPCGALNPNCPCMEGGTCSKN